jgi:hypothetical protein
VTARLYHLETIAYAVQSWLVAFGLLAYAASVLMFVESLLCFFVLFVLSVPVFLFWLFFSLDSSS